MAILVCDVTSYFILAILVCHFFVLLKIYFFAVFFYLLKMFRAGSGGFIKVFLIVTGCFIKAFWAVTNNFVHALLGCTFLIYSSFFWL